MSAITESRFKSSDGIHNCYYITATPREEPKGILQISHGMCEYIDRYRDFALFMADNGYIVCGNDHLGHGKTADSPDDLGYFAEKNGWQCAVEDLHRLTRIMKERYPELPYYLLGHSMGSFLARAYAIKHGHECEAFIFMGTADGFESAISELLENVGRLTAKLEEKKGKVNTGRLSSGAITALLSQGELLKKIKGDRYRSEILDKIAFGKSNDRIENCRTRYDWITRDNEIVDKYSADPYCTFIFTVNGFLNLASVLWYVSNEKWYANIPKDIPILLLAGDADPVGNYANGVRAVYDKLCSYRADAAIKIYEGARHELLNEINRTEVYEDILQFLKNI